MSGLPPGWAQTTLGELAGTVRGLTYKKEQAGSQPRSGLVPLVRATNLQGGRLLLDQELIFVPETLIRDEQWLHTGDIVIASSSGSAAVVGKSAPLGHPWLGTFGAFCAVLRPDRGIADRFLAYFVASPAIRTVWSGLAAGTNINNLKPSHIAQTTVDLPPRDEQRRIVAAIEEQFPRLDTADASLIRTLRLLALLRRSVVGTAFAGQRPTQALVELTDPGRPICYGILKPRTNGDLRVPYVEVRSIRGGRIDLASLHRTTQALHQEFRRSELRSGDVVLAIRGSFDRAAVVPEALNGANVSRDVARISPGPELASSFLAYYLGGPHAHQFFASVARGVGVRGVNIGDLRRMPIPVLPLEEQHRIVAEVEQQLSLIDAMRTAIEAAQRRGASLRRAILDRAFRGELVPQDPSDEPASVLLEHIRAEQAAAPPARRASRRRSTTASEQS